MIKEIEKMELSKLHIDGQWFTDEYGRRVILRGVNLGGDCKVPWPDGGTHIPTDFSDHREVSFVGRPFPLDEAHEHLSRLRGWGFNVLRLLTTWEAVEHRGPGEYDEEYLDYYAKICDMAGRYGLFVFVDFHQDVWSRMTGGDGAPCWLFEKIGIDYTKISAADAALVMQMKYDYSDPRPRQEENYPTMNWFTNYRYSVNGIMWTLFFAGRDFAPEMLIDGKNVQDYLQGHYIDSMVQVAKRVKDMPHVLGFDSLNEPGQGWIGSAMDLSDVDYYKGEPEMPGIIWSPVNALAASHGLCLEVPMAKVSLLKGRPVPRGTVTVNRNRVSIWLPGHTDPFQSAGAWELKGDGSFAILRNDFFRTVKGKPVEFEEDCLSPFMGRVADAVRSIRKDWMIFGEKPAEKAFYHPRLSGSMPENFINATHWYDNVILGLKMVSYPVTRDLLRDRWVFGLRNIENMYVHQLGRFREASTAINGGCPTLIGEFGIPYDINGARAYRKWDRGKRNGRIWKKHVQALDLMYNAMDRLFLNSTQWNYTASNRNDLRAGDGWNQEDLSIFSRDQQTDKNDSSSGGRALEGFVRPFARLVQGTPLEMKFDLMSGLFVLVFEADPDIPEPTEIFVPALQYPRGYAIEAQGADIVEDREGQVVFLKARKKERLAVRISRS
jgi:hypothetical protein